MFSYNGLVRIVAAGAPCLIALMIANIVMSITRPRPKSVVGGIKGDITELLSDLWASLGVGAALVFTGLKKNELKGQ